jgi:hypothetical protein
VTAWAFVFVTVNVASPELFAVAVAGVIVDVPPALCASVTVRPPTELPPLSLSVTLIVEDDVPSATSVLGLAVTDEFEAEARPPTWMDDVVLVNDPVAPPPLAVALTVTEVPTLPDVVIVQFEKVTLEVEVL